ncbi:YHS domain-containing protein [Nordella sp. HKS 07]|uniref:YHS domain-containing protein n=1 Tax=Nordella sp. HKS 07 TaxID=2712222 RepID=UPI0013E0F4B4|nr:YHS domain-containing protein [Nordella sp. HKS 07]QIG47175.1 YHS domain-containing protein [Nordella sp. HKS 07]
MQALLYFLLWAGLIFLMMRFGCGSHVMGHGHRHGGPRPDESSDLPGTNVRRTPEKARDPVCGMTVDTANAKPSLYEGRAYYFCSQTCRDKFEASPASYAKGETSRSSTMESGHEHH